MNVPLPLRRFLALSSLILGATAPATAEATKPNIVFIISDDHAWNDYGLSLIHI